MDRKLNYNGVRRLQRSCVRSGLGSPICAHDGPCDVVFGDAPYSTKQWLRPPIFVQATGILFFAGGPRRARTSVSVTCKTVHGANDRKVNVKALPWVDRHT